MAILQQFYIQIFRSCLVILSWGDDGQCSFSKRTSSDFWHCGRVLYRVYKKKLNRFEIALNFAKHLFVSGFLYI